MGVLQTLLERRLIRTLGRKKVVGKPILYGTTDEFLVHFGLNSLADLPSLEDFPGIAPGALPEGGSTEAAGEMQEGMLSHGPEMRSAAVVVGDALEPLNWDEERVLDSLRATEQADGRPHDEEE
jgi:segregation and condensation protein B